MLALLLPLQPVVQLASITRRAHCRFTVPPGPPGLPGPFLQSCFLSGWCPAYTLAWVALSQVKDFALPLSNSITLWSGHPLQPGRVPRGGSLTPQCSDCSHRVNASTDTDLLRVTSFPKFRLLIETMNKC